MDVNHGTQVFEEVETMEWFVRTIREISDAPLYIASPSVNALAEGLEVAKTNGETTNGKSITAGKRRFENTLPLVLEHGVKVVDDKGIPDAVRDRMAVNEPFVSWTAK